MDRADTQQTGIVFNIQKYSVHDGPGIRTVVFAKGCPLACAWCSNPESQEYAPQLAYNANKCIHCGQCVAVCTDGAISKKGEGGVVIERGVCQEGISRCTSACFSQALIAYGKEYTVDEVLAIVEQDMAFYRRSGGGMTLSGGEPLAQKEFALSLLREARRRWIKTSIETSGFVEQGHLLAVAPYLNHVMFDIKHIDGNAHKKGTGVDNRLILDNLAALAGAFPSLTILVRTPVVPGFNDSPEVIGEIARFVQNNNRSGNLQYELLPYHRLGTQKYEFLQRHNPMHDASLDNTLFQTLQTEANRIMQRS